MLTADEARRISGHPDRSVTESAIEGNIRIAAAAGRFCVEFYRRSWPIWGRKWLEELGYEVMLLRGEAPDPTADRVEVSWR